MTIDAESSYTIEEFCNAERISRSMFYKLRERGKAPVVSMLVRAFASHRKHAGSGGASARTSRTGRPRDMPSPDNEKPADADRGLSEAVRSDGCEPHLDTKSLSQT